MSARPYTMTAAERSRMAKSLLTILEAHRGKRNAVKGADLARELGQRDDRLVRILIRELIAEGVPVASSVGDPQGFYLVATPGEAQEYMAVLEARIREDEARLRDFRRAAEASLGALAEQPQMM
jgi:hypothetical protein